MEVTITKVNRTQRTSKAGKPYTSLGIQTNEHGADWLSGFGNKDNEGWKPGDKVEITIVEKPGSDGKVYKNFETVKKGSPDMEKIIKELVRLDMGQKLLTQKIDEVLTILKREVDKYPVMDSTNDARDFDTEGLDEPPEEE